MQAQHRAFILSDTLTHNCDLLRHTYHLGYSTPLTLILPLSPSQFSVSRLPPPEPAPWDQGPRVLPAPIIDLTDPDPDTPPPMRTPHPTSIFAPLTPPLLLSWPPISRGAHLAAQMVLRVRPTTRLPRCSSQAPPHRLRRSFPRSLHSPRLTRPRHPRTLPSPSPLPAAAPAASPVPHAKSSPTSPAICKL
ncbi:hypothetical protein HETIRDRAFT_108675 [Heterobasidion irregulare TC 32-1]|uniref:Uncharacterized protein n=1 Tax=Heterobasidion irregulare (strain TC 32-1) TaxID=747525 RepID=W4K053_HETIT|nr:uncharacterized protein HETIRDRAFT_108675 [Heterobasidion irregulare TC 32-1]ETW78481.1 hypothetical protein HETIRDRAFT_108675 [Heterobasidion irregulare TC 32-1]